jgi:basic amino acid/polyamine antiporter, APA family
VCFSVIWLREKRPDLERHFRVPLYPVLPALGVVACFVLAWIGVESHIRWFFAKFLLGAIAIYFVYGFWKSPLRGKKSEEGTASS